MCEGIVIIGGKTATLARPESKTTHSIAIPHWSEYRQNAPLTCGLCTNLESFQNRFQTPLKGKNRPTTLAIGKSASALNPTVNGAHATITRDMKGRTMAAINLLQSTAKAIVNLFSNEINVPGVSNTPYLGHTAHVSPKTSSEFGRLAC